MDRTQRAPQRMLAALLRLLHKHLHRFFRKKWIRHEALQYACGLKHALTFFVSLCLCGEFCFTALTTKARRHKEPKTIWLRLCCAAFICAQFVVWFILFGCGHAALYNTVSQKRRLGKQNSSSSLIDAGTFFR